jgi:hypothetical protein
MLEDEGLEILSEEECRNLVGMARVGRVGVTIGAVAAIFPVNFAVLDGDIVSHRHRHQAGRGDTELGCGLRG